MKDIKKSFNRIKLKDNSIKNEAFNRYQLSNSIKFIKVFIAVIGLFNIVLIVPDMINLSCASARLLVIVLRTTFSLITALLFIFINKIKLYKKLALIITICELFFVFIFFRIFYLYDSPDFMIQTLGVFIIIIVVFLIPNLWSNMIMVAVIITAGFFLSAYFNIENLNQTQMIAGIVYLLIEIVLCAIFAFYFNRYQRGEYSTKTELQRIYATDPLTQVGNRIRLEDEAEKWLEFCSRHHLPLSLVLVDVDNMKQINDQYGHLAGDVILYEMAQIMYTQLRKNDVCARWGGDEFILLLPYTNLDEAKSLTERIREAISKYKFNINIDTTCSFGIVSMKEGLNLGQLIKQADALMYMAKKSGKDNIEINAQVQSHFDE